MEFSNTEAVTTLEGVQPIAFAPDGRPVGAEAAWRRKIEPLHLVLHFPETLGKSFILDTAITILPSHLYSVRLATSVAVRNIRMALASTWRSPVNVCNSSGHGLLWPISSILLNFSPAAFDP